MFGVEAGSAEARKRGLYCSAAVLATICGAGTAQASGTKAGTLINNTATATYNAQGGGDAVVESNTVSLRVDELLDVTVASADPGDVATVPGSTNQVLTFSLTNVGNGAEAFRLSSNATLAGDDFDPTVTSIVIDANGNGQYDAGIDTVYSAGSNDPVLEADESITVFILSTIDPATADGSRAQAQLTATAVTGSGTAGSAFPGAGTDGGDAVVGATSASALAGGFYKAAAATVSFVKAAAIVDTFGGARPLPGATVTYSLRATVNGTGTISNIRVADTIPAGTSYRAGTLRLDGQPLSDAVDGDAGNVSASGLAVALGDVAAGASRTVDFQVVIRK
ncbi:MAG TPA: hypothetical protein VF636_05995 [Sphingomonas sp.]|jgi:uncharacterized repeat protein (TIGR01451 family)